MPTPTSTALVTNSQPNFFQDPVWQFIGAVLGLVAIIVSIVLFWLTLHRKSLAYRVVSSTQLLNLGQHDQLKGKLQLLYENNPVQDPYLLLIQVANVGNVAIRPEDYVKPVRVTFGDNAAVLSAEITESYPSDIELQITNIGSGIELENALLNRKDKVVIQVLVGTFGGQVKVDGRIVDVKSIQEQKPIEIPIGTVTNIGSSNLVDTLWRFLGPSPTLWDLSMDLVRWIRRRK
jgi:hypothetical protein